MKWIIILVLALLLTGCVVKCPQCPDVTCPDPKKDIIIDFPHQKLTGECDAYNGPDEDVNVSIMLRGDGFKMHESDYYRLHYPDFWVDVDGKVDNGRYCWLTRFKYNFSIDGTTKTDALSIDVEDCDDYRDCHIISDIAWRLENE